MFPAYAGMIRNNTFSPLSSSSVPRLRGDDPSEGVESAIRYACSPPTRG